MSEKNLKPSVITTLSQLKDHLLKHGLSERDMLILLQDRIRILDTFKKSRKMGIKEIKAVIDGIEKLERDIIRNKMNYKKEK